jgi:hypothetical protein
MSAKPTSPVINTAHALYSADVASYPFTEGSGATVHDIAHGHDFTLTGSPVWGIDADGAKLQFNGTTQSGDSGEVTAFATLQNGDFAIRMILRRDYFGGRRETLLSTFDASGRGFLVDILSNDAMRFLCSYGADGNNARYCDTVDTFNTTSIYTMWLIMRSGTIEMWRNGTNLAGATATIGTIAPVTSTSSLKLATGFANPYYGDFTAIDIFNRAPTTTERTNLDGDPWSLYAGSGGATSRLLLARRKGVLQ